MTLDFWLASPSQFIVRCCLGTTVVWLIAAATTLLLQRFSAALRHRIWSLSMLAAMVAPLAVLMLPELRVGWIELDKGPFASPLAKESASFISDPAVKGEPKQLSINESNLVSPPIAPKNSLGESSGASISPESRRDDSISHSIGAYWPTLLLIPLIWQFARIGRSLLAVQICIRQSEAITDLRALRVLAAWHERLGAPVAVQLRSSTATKVPLCTGIWQPTIILPEQWQEWAESKLSAAVGHELAHISRRDVVWQLLAAIVCALYWFHPLSYVAAWRMRIEREAACDDVVLGAGQSPIEYARILLDLAKQLSTAETPSLILPMAAGTDFEQRVQAILAKGRARNPVHRTANFLLAGTTVILIAAIGSLSPLSNGISPPILAAEQAATDYPAVSPDKPIPAAKVETGERVEVQGEVVDANGKPVAGIEVTDIGDREIIAVRTNSKGTFSFSILRNRKSTVLFVARSADGQQQGFAQVDLYRKPLPAAERIVLAQARAIEFHVVDAERRPVADAVVVATSTYYKLTDAKTNRDGKAVLLVPEQLSLQYVYAVKPNLGLDYFMIRQGSTSTSSMNGELLPAALDKPVTLTLTGTRPIRVRCVDENNQPLAGVRVSPWYVMLPNKGGNLNTVWERGMTNREGYVDFHTIPAANVTPITFWSRTEKYFAPQRNEFNPRSTSNEMTVKLLPRVPVKGSVKLRDGKPGAGAIVSTVGNGNGGDSFSEDVTCNEKGEFEIYVDTDKCYLFTARLGQLASASVARLVLTGQDTDAVELSLEPATRIFGTLRSPTDGKPRGGEWLQVYSRNGGNYLELVKGKRLTMKTDPRVSYEIVTDEKGHFEVLVGRGEYWVIGSNVRKNPTTIELNGQKELEVTLETDLPPDIELSVTTVLASDKSQTVAEVTINAVPFPRQATGDFGHNFGALTDAEGKCVVKRSPTEMLVTARSKDGLLGSIAILSPEAKDLVIPLVPTATARGRLLDATGKPIAGQRIDYDFKQSYPGGSTTFHYGNFTGTAITDAQGDFTLKGVFVGGNYELQVIELADLPVRDRLKVGKGFKPDKDVIDLGDLTVSKQETAPAP